MRGDLIRLHLRLARQGLAWSALLALGAGAALAWPEQILGHPPTARTLLRLAEEFLVLLVLPVAVALWSDVEGRRPGLWRALPFRRGAVTACRLVLPLAVYGLVTGGLVVAGGLRMPPPVGPLDPASGLRLVAAGLPVAAVLGAVAAAGAVLTRVPAAGAAVALAWWAVESMTGGDLTGMFFLFAASHGLPGGGAEPDGALSGAVAGIGNGSAVPLGAEEGGLIPAGGGTLLPPARLDPMAAGGAPGFVAFGTALLVNRLLLTALAVLAGMLTAWLYGRDEPFLRQG